jgi:type III restriction enzyme
MMNHHVHAIAGRLSLRPPQRRSLEILDRIMAIVPPQGRGDLAGALAAIRGEFPTVADFERAFPSLCFALATGVGKTRLMGAFIAYLHLAHGLNNFFVLAPNLTIYNKLIADFTPNTPKYVFQGIAEFAVDAPEIITGDNYETRARTLFDELIRCKINIFNIAKINSEVRGGKAPRIKRLSEYIGQSYFDYLASLPDLVLLMDESHRYRASAGVRAINELRPCLGLELTATPFVEAAHGPVPFRNVIFDYPLSQAMGDGFVKEPAVITRRDFNPAGMSPEAVERLKLEDGLRLHEQTKVLLEAYARERGERIVKPFLLVIARDTAHASHLMALIQHVDFFDGRYRDKVIQVDSSRTGAEEDLMVERLLKVEHPNEPTEIVIHVNMLKEGWDVTNLYTIVPLRAANARILIEQSIGRGLRLPYGKRTGVTAIDRLNIVAHDRFQEILNEANRPDSPIRLQAVVLAAEELRQTLRTVIAPPTLASKLGLVAPLSLTTEIASGQTAPAFATPAEQQVAQLTYAAIRKLEHQPEKVPTVTYLSTADIQAELLREVAVAYQPTQLGLEGLAPTPDLPAVVAQTAALVIQQTIDIPRILVVPQGKVRTGFRPFTLDLSALHYQPPADDLWIHYLRTGGSEVVGLHKAVPAEARFEDYIVSGLIDFDDIAYDDHADLLYNLAAQTVAHFRRYLSEEETHKVLRLQQRDVARFIHAQLHHHYWEEAVGYDVVVSKGFSALKACTYSTTEPALDFHQSLDDKSNMARYLFDGFGRCLYPVQKFHSEAERILAVILDRESEKWFRPAQGQFQLVYQVGAEQREYQPDFVAETAHVIYMLEPKARHQLQDSEVLAKRAAALLWCERATAHAATYGGKPWRYLLIPHDALAVNMTIDGLAAAFS